MKRFWLVWLVLTGVLGVAHLYLALIWSPPEVWIHDLVRIMYFHVACAWIAFLSFFVTFASAILYLVRRKVWWDSVSLCSAELGLVYTTFTLVSGSLWGRAIWNTWWTWDPRLTTTLILWFLYVGYLLLRGTISGIERRGRIAAVYAILAFIDVPVIHMSVTWWRSIHPNVIDETGFNMPGAMIVTLLLGFVSFLFLYVIALSLRVNMETQRLEIRAIRESLHKRNTHLRGEGSKS